MDNERVILFSGRLQTPGYALAGIDIRKEVYDKHIKEGLTHEEIKRKYLDQFLARFKK